MRPTSTRCAVLSTAFSLLVIASSWAQETVAYNTTLFDTLNPNEGGGRYSALWGYTTPDGREYALLGGFTGTHIIDITEKPIKEITFIPGPLSGWREMKTFGTYAYVVSEGGGGLQIIDLSTLPDDATLVKSDTTWFRTGHTITQEGDWLYVHGSNVGAGVNGGTLILDVASDPLNPTLIGAYDRDYVHDATIRNDTMYAAMILNGRLDIVYLGADRTDPEFVTEITYPGAGTHNADLTIDGRYVMTSDEVGATPKTLKVWDLADLDDIVKVADWTPAEGETIHNVHIKGTVAYIAWYSAGTRIVDISDPVNPVEIGFYDTSPGSGPQNFGNWEVYPYFESGKIISSEMARGLYVFTFDGAKKGLANGIVRDSVTGEALGDVVVDFPDLGRSIMTDADGRFQLLAAEGEIGFTARLLNYRLEEGRINLSSDGTDIEILMSPLALRSISLVPIDDETGSEIERFAFNVRTRGDGNGTPSVVLQLPVDSSYTVLVGAWGWLPEEVTIDPNVEDDIVVGLKRGYSDDVELDLGWSLSEPDDDGVGGKWDRGIPLRLRLQLPGRDPVVIVPGNDHTPGNGVKAFLTGVANPETSGLGLSDLDSGRVTLTSPEFDLSSYNDPRISFWLWYVNGAFGFSPQDDQLYVRLSNDGGGSWTDVATLDTVVQDWTPFTIRVIDYIPPTETMLFRLVAADSNEQGWVEAGLDDFLVSDTVIVSVGQENEGRSGTGLTVVPNPFTGSATVHFSLQQSQQKVRLELLDLFGRSILPLYQGRLSQGEVTIPLEGDLLQPGVYHLRVLFDDGSSLNRKISLVK